jgi:hypothetical protein
MTSGHLKTRTLVRFDKDKLGTEQSGADKIVFRDACNFLGAADVGEQRDFDAVLSNTRQSLRNRDRSGETFRISVSDLQTSPRPTVWARSQRFPFGHPRAIVSRRESLW